MVFVFVLLIVRWRTSYYGWPSCGCSPLSEKTGSPSFHLYGLQYRVSHFFMMKRTSVVLLMFGQISSLATISVNHSKYPLSLYLTTSVLLAFLLLYSHQSQICARRHVFFIFKVLLIQCHHTDLSTVTIPGFYSVPRCLIIWPFNLIAPLKSYPLAKQYINSSAFSIGIDRFWNMDPFDAHWSILCFIHSIVLVLHTRQTQFLFEDNSTQSLSQLRHVSLSVKTSLPTLRIFNIYKEKSLITIISQPFLYCKV